MIGLAMSGRVGGHVGENAVGRPAEHLLQACRRIRLVEIHHCKVGAGDRIDMQEIDADYAALAFRRTDALCSDLRPAARRSTEIDNALTGFQQMVLVVDLDELERGARTKAFEPRPRDIGIVELALEPERRGEGPFARGLDARLQRSSALASGFLSAALWRHATVSH